MKFVLIPPGEFVMGSPADEQGRRLGEGPQHRVQILQPFYLGRYEVTQAEYQQVTRDNPSMTAGAGNGRLPVEEVSWDEVTQFCQRLGQAEGKSYRLPTEAEWEFACRAGTTTQFSFGDDPALLAKYGWYANNAQGSTRAVGLMAANPFGLHDMHGNVFEWCQDWFSEGYYLKSTPADPIGPSSGTKSRASRW